MVENVVAIVCVTVLVVAVVLIVGTLVAETLRDRQMRKIMRQANVEMKWENYERALNAYECEHALNVRNSRH